MNLKMLFPFLISALFFSNANSQFTTTNKLACTAVQDQYLSGTCWSFASLSFLESEMIRQKIPVVNLSEMFVARRAYMYKIKEHLKRQGKNFFTSGGQFQDVTRVINEYGIMPEEAYSGKPNKNKGHNHGDIDTLIVHFVNKLVAAKVTTLTLEKENYINSLFDKYLGKLPTTFIYKNKNYTAKSFAKEVFKLKMNDYMSITSYNHHPLNKNIVLEDKYNWSNSTYYNIAYDTFIKITPNALQKGYTVLWDGDVTEESFDFGNGTAFLKMSSENLQELEEHRNRTFKTQESKIDHVMHIVGTAENNEKENCYYIKNSWGNSNNYNGFLYMNLPYFAIKTIAIVVHKDLIVAK